jgi:hypothetical protein
MHIKRSFESYNGDKDDESINLITDLYYTYLEDCKSFTDFKVVKRKDNVYSIILEFSKETMKNRKSSGNFRIKTDEIVDYWKNISDFILVLKSNGYESNIEFYQPNGVSLNIGIKKYEN